MISNEAFPTVGILGAGQLGRMTGFAALRMGCQVRLLTPKPTGAMQGVGRATVGDWTDAAILRGFADQCDLLTVENEWAPIDEMDAARPSETEIWPRPHTLELIRHKGVQNDTLHEAGLPLPDYRRCATVEEAIEAADALGYPVVVKKYTRAYDGYGNAFASERVDVKKAWEELADEDGLLVEERVDFERELSGIVARRPGGQHVVYPIAYTEQRDHRCHAVRVPAELSADRRREARRIAVEAVEAVDGVGVNAVELFHEDERGFLVNEIAPRPHNTGHYSIEGSYTSQFENHLRAVLDWPLGDPGLRESVAVMVNLLGHREGDPRPNGIAEALEVPDVAVHIYGKAKVRPNRKMGHVTATGENPEDTRERAERAASAIEL